MSIRLGVVMDPIDSIKIHKDSSFAMLLAAQKRGWELYYMQPQDLIQRDDAIMMQCHRLRVEDNPEHWFELEEPALLPVQRLDILLMRKDPPLDMEYLYSTYLLERAQALGVLVANRPSGIRDVNEKLYTGWFPDCCTPSLATRNMRLIREFLTEHQDIIVKPLNAMGGASVFRIRTDDPNTSVILETITANQTSTVMAQRFIPEISAGDKRILMVDGEPVPYALARIPARGETRGNLAAGGRGEGVPLSERDRYICAQVGPMLREKGLYFVGIDVIGDYLTEINVTSPTCIRELDALYGLDIGGQLMDALERRLAQHRNRA